MTGPIRIGDYAPGSDEWLALRATGIGGSDAAAVLGWSPWTSPWALWCIKTGLVSGEIEEHEALEFGRKLEGVVADTFAERTGLVLHDTGGTFRHPEHEFMLASPDRLILNPEDPRVGIESGLLEVKTTSAFKAEDWADDQIPDYYLAQWTHTAHVMGCTWGFFAVLIGGNRMVMREVEYDPEMAEMLVAEEERFWREHVLTNVAPPIDALQSTTDMLAQMYADAQPDSTVELDETVAAALVAYRRASDAAKEAEDAKRRAGNVLRDALGENETATFGGVPVATWKAQGRDTFDFDRFAAEHPDLVGRYRKQDTSRVLRPGRSKAALEALEALEEKR